MVYNGFNKWEKDKGVYTMTAQEIYNLLKHDDAYSINSGDVINLAIVLRAHGLFVDLDETWRLVRELDQIAMEESRGNCFAGSPSTWEV